MIKWLKLLFHCHEWKIIKEVEVYRVSMWTGEQIDAYPSYTQLYLQCKICGSIKVSSLSQAAAKNLME